MDYIWREVTLEGVDRDVYMTLASFSLYICKIFISIKGPVWKLQGQLIFKLKIFILLWWCALWEIYDVIRTNKKPLLYISVSGANKVLSFSK